MLCHLSRSFVSKITSKWRLDFMLRVWASRKILAMYHAICMSSGDHFLARLRLMDFGIEFPCIYWVGNISDCPFFCKVS